MALVLFGEVVDGARAAEIGLAWKCVPDSELLAVAHSMAAKAAAGPTDVVRSMKATILANDAITNSEDAVSAELGPQLASLSGDAFVELLAKLRAQIASKS
jgi:enoyl-CoA hydratase